MCETGLELIVRCNEVNAASRVLREMFHYTLSEITGRQKIYAFKDRVKDTKNIWRKIMRKRKEGAKIENESKRTGNYNIEFDLRRVEYLKNYGPKQISDGWGCRFVTLFTEQVPTIVSDILSALNENFTNKQTRISLVEAIVYMSSASEAQAELGDKVHSILIDKRFASIRDKNANIEKQMRKGYSSIHMIFEVPLVMDFAKSEVVGDDMQLDRVQARFEIQVRDIFEEAWSEAEHYIFYRHKDDSDTKQPDVIKKAKRNVDDARGHLDTLRLAIGNVKIDVEEEYERRKGYNIERQSLSALQEDRKIISDALIKAGWSEIAEKISDAYNLMETAQNAPTSQPELIYRQVAQRWDESRKMIANNPSAGNVIAGKEGRNILYHLDIEQANAWFFSKDQELLSSALELYKILNEKYPNDHIISYRYARAIWRACEVGTLTADHAKTALEFLDKISNRTSQSAEAVHWLPVSASVLEGYIHFGLAGKIKDSVTVNIHDRRQKYYEELRKAISKTESGIKYWGKFNEIQKSKIDYAIPAHKAASNLIYYYAIAIQFEKKHPSTSGSNAVKVDYASKMRAMFNLIKGIELPKLRDSYKSDDNLMHGYVALGEKSEALRLAESIYKEIHTFANERAGASVDTSEIHSFLEKGEIACFRAASAVLWSEGETWED